MIAAHILTHSPVGFAEMHVAGFRIERRRLRSALGLAARISVRASREELLAAAGEPADLLMLTTDWRRPVGELIDIVRAMRERGARRIVYLDTFDQTSSPYFGILPDVDAYVKAKMLEPVSRYGEPYAGGFIVADYCQRELRIPLNGWEFGSTLDSAHARKLVPGWNFAVSRRIRVLLRLSVLLGRSLPRRPLDLHARIGPPGRQVQEWYERYRDLAARAVQGLPAAIRATSLDRVPQRRYLRELLSCKMAFSPFGWGEVCLRDYEAVACGCLLVKPDMGHVRTSPDIYTPNETYVPVRWDFADLGEVCAGMLQRPDEMHRIATNARRRLTDYYGRAGFVEDVRRVLVAAGAAQDGSGRL